VHRCALATLVCGIVFAAMLQNLIAPERKHPPAQRALGPSWQR
jgi:hypothetical protein